MLLHNDIDMPFPKPGRGRRISSRRCASCFSGTRRRRSSGRTWAWAASSSRWSTRSRMIEERPRGSRPSRTSTSTSRGTRSRSTSSTRRGDRSAWPISSTATRTASCSAPTRWRPGRGEYLRRSTTCTSRCGVAHARRRAQKVRKGNYERLFDAARQGPARGKRRTSKRTEADVREPDHEPPPPGSLVVAAPCWPITHGGPGRLERWPRPRRLAPRLSDGRGRRSPCRGQAGSTSTAS